MRVLFGICGSSVKTNVVVVDGSNAQPPVCLPVDDVCALVSKGGRVGELRSGNHKTLSKSRSRARAANAIYRGDGRRVSVR